METILITKAEATDSATVEVTSQDHVPSLDPLSEQLQQQQTPTAPPPPVSIPTSSVVYTQWVASILTLYSSVHRAS